MAKIFDRYPLVMGVGCTPRRLAIRKMAKASNQYELGSAWWSGADYFSNSTVSGLSLKLLQALNRTGQFEMATICGISARMTI